MEVKCPGNFQKEVTADYLLEYIQEMKNKKLRLCAISAAWVQGKYELSYSFADDDTLELKTLRIVIDRETEIPSITDFYPCASFYENEMAEMFGVKVRFINGDLHNKLYRINVETPMLPKEER